jgi:hypothetical protein
VDLGTDDHRAWHLAPHLVVVGASAGSIEWMNPETGTTCQILPDEATCHDACPRAVAGCPHSGWRRS